jgi:hypothetical protein
VEAVLPALLRSASTAHSLWTIIFGDLCQTAIPHSFHMVIPLPPSNILLRSFLHTIIFSQSLRSSTLINQFVLVPLYFYTYRYHNTLSLFGYTPVCHCSCCFQRPSMNEFSSRQKPLSSRNFLVLSYFKADA